MPSLDSMMLRQIIMDHYENPRNHGLVDDDNYQSVNMDSETCIDDIDVQALIEDGVIKKATSPVITTQCIRVPVLDGHTAAVFVKFAKKPTKEQLIEAMTKFSGEPQELDLPSAPKQFIQYLEEDNRPQVQLDVNFEKGMGISVGRLREDTVYDYKFVGLSHNTLRGAAGGAVLSAELLVANGYIEAK